jgi:hypothetical protein
LAKPSRRAPATQPLSHRTRPRSRYSERGPLERYRTLLITGFGLAGLLLIGYFMFGRSAGTAYACGTLLTPGPVESLTPQPPTPTPSPVPSITPTPSPAASPSPTTTAPAGSPTPTPSPTPSPTPQPTPTPEPTPRLGFTTADLGRQHVLDPNATLQYGYCPPASGEHFAIQNVGPIRSALYPPSAGEKSPGGWVHNLEHGFVVVLYRCPSATPGSGDCISAADLQMLQQYYDDNEGKSGISQCPNKTVVARFDSMSTPFAILAWDRVLLIDHLDLDTLNTFTQQWLDHVSTPERGLCY